MTNFNLNCYMKYKNIAVINRNRKLVRFKKEFS